MVIHVIHTELWFVIIFILEAMMSGLIVFYKIIKL